MHPHRLLNRLPVLILFAILLVAGCGDDGPSGPDGGNPSNAPMSARIDGQTWEAQVAFAPPTFTPGHVAAVSGASGTTTIAFAYQVIDGANEYPIGNSPTNALLTIGSDTWAASAAGLPGTGGTITITHNTAERIEGTFEFVLGRSVNGQTQLRTVSNGRFNITR